MKDLKKRDDEMLADFLQRLRAKFATPEYKAKKREENFIQGWKHGKRDPKPKRVGREFHPPERGYF